MIGTISRSVTPSPRQMGVGPKNEQTYPLARLISFIGLIQSQIDYMACSLWVNVDPRDVLGKSYFHMSSPSMQTNRGIRSRAQLLVFWPDIHLTWGRCETCGNSSNQFLIPINLGIDTKIKSLAILEPKLRDLSASLTGPSAHFLARHPFDLGTVRDFWK